MVQNDGRTTFHSRTWIRFSSSDKFLYDDILTPQKILCFLQINQYIDGQVY